MLEHSNKQVQRQRSIESMCTGGRGRGGGGGERGSDVGRLHQTGEGAMHPSDVGRLHQTVLCCSRVCVCAAQAHRHTDTVAQARASRLCSVCALSAQCPWSHGVGKSRKRIICTVAAFVVICSVEHTNYVMVNSMFQDCELQCTVRSFDARRSTLQQVSSLCDCSAFRHCRIFPVGI